MQSVAQPLHDRTADEDTALEGVVHLVADLPRHGRDQVVLREDGLLAAVHQQEAARAVGVLDHARLGAHLAEERGLLVAGDTRNGDLVGEDRGLGVSVDLARGLDLGHHRTRNAEQVEQLLVPIQRVDVEEHRARGVAHVRHMDLTARKAPDEPRVHRTEHQLAFLGTLAGSGDIVQNPLDLRGAEVGVDDQTGLLTDHVGEPLFLQFVAVVRRAAVLPDDGVVDRLLGLRIPDDGRLTLVGNADAGQIQSVDVHDRNCLGDDRCLRSPDLVGVVLDPSRLGEDLPEFALCHGTGRSLLVENDGPGTARSLVQSKNVLFHDRFGWWFLV